MIRNKDDGSPMSADCDWPSFDVSESQQSGNMSGGNKKSDRGASSRSSRSSREAKGEGRKGAYELGLPEDIASEDESGLPTSRTDGEESSVCEISFSLRTKQNTERNGKTLNLAVPGRRLQEESSSHKKSKEKKTRYKEDFEEGSLPLAREKHGKKKSVKHASETEDSEAKTSKKNPSSPTKLVLMVEPRETSSDVELRQIRSMSSLAESPRALAGLRRGKDKAVRRKQVPKERHRRPRSNEYVFSEDKCSHCGAGTEISGDINGRLPTCPYCLEELGLIRDGAPGLSRTLRMGNASYEALIDPGGLLMPGYPPNDTDLSESGQYYEIPNKMFLPSVPTSRSPPREAIVDRHYGYERWPSTKAQQHQPMCHRPRTYSPRRAAPPPEQQVMPEHLTRSRASPDRRRAEAGARSRSPTRISGGGSPVNRFPGRYQGTASHRRFDPADSDSCLLVEPREDPWAPSGYGPPLCYKRRQEPVGHRSPTSRRTSPQRAHV